MSLASLYDAFVTAMRDSRLPATSKKYGVRAALVTSHGDRQEAGVGADRRAEIAQVFISHPDMQELHNKITGLAGVTKANWFYFFSDQPGDVTGSNHP